MDRQPGHPCPWVGCRHHLLLEVTEGARRPTTLRLNRSPHRPAGRARGLRANAAERIVRGWIDQAIETLFSMPFTCALDVVDAHPDGLVVPAIGRVLGISKQSLYEGQRKPHIRTAIEQLTTKGIR